MKAVGVIPARWASTRFPGKSLAPICGRPLIQWVIERVRQARALDLVCVATDDTRIAEVARRAGAQVAMTRSDHPSGTDRIAEAVAAIPCQVVVNIQGDEPLIDPGLVDRVARALLDDSAWDMATAAAPVRRAEDLASPSVVKVVWGADERALYFSRAPIPFVRDAGAAAEHWRHIGIYGYRREFLMRLVTVAPVPLEKAEMLEQLRALHIGARMKVLKTDDVGIGVDTPADVDYVENVLKSRGCTP